jgi:hypothetical protein
MKRAAVISILVLFLGLSPGFSKKLAVLPQLTAPNTIDIYGDELYVLEDAEVYVYSLKDYRLLRRFGKRGEGPGQLMPNTEVPLAMTIVNGSVYLNSQLKMIKYSKEGKSLAEQQIPFSFQTIPFGKNYASIKIGLRHDIHSFIATLLDPGFNNLEHFYSRERISRSQRGKLSLPPEIIIIRCSGDKIFLFDQQSRGFVINVYDSQGKQLKPIKMDYQRIKTSDSFERDAIAWFKAQPSFRMAAEELREMIYFPDYLPVIRNFLARKGRLYIQTYKTENHLSEFIILDVEGRLIKRLYLPGFANSPLQFNASHTFTFYNDKYYYLEEHDRGWEINMEELK